MAEVLRDDAIIDLAVVKDELGITTSAKDDSIRRYINFATGAINKYCNRVFARATVTDEKHKGFGVPFLIVKRPPLVSITSVSFGDVALDAADYEIHGDGGSGMIYLVSRTIDTALNRPDIAQDRDPGTERYMYKTTYVGGYIGRHQARSGGPYAGQTVDMPPDVEHAALLTVVTRYRKQGRDPTVHREWIGDASKTYGGNLGPHEASVLGLPVEAALMLDHHRMEQI